MAIEVFQQRLDPHAGPVFPVSAEPKVLAVGEIRSQVYEGAVGQQELAKAAARTREHEDGWLWHFNHRRRHSGLGHRRPVSRTNVLGTYS
jgi:hypothetical protein